MNTALNATELPRYANLPKGATRSRLVSLRHDAVPGRARLAIRGLHNSPLLKKILEEEIAKFPYVAFCQANTSTASMLVRFAEGVATEGLRRETEKIVRRAILSLARNEPFGQARLAGDDWHARKDRDICSALNTSPDSGLTASVASKRLHEEGPNIIRGLASPSDWNLFFAQLKNLPTALLAAAAVLSIPTGGALDAILISGVLFINGVVGFRTEKKARRIISGIDRPSFEKITVIRDGKECRISESSLVKGDIYVVRSGLVPADSRLLKSRRLTVDESPLTGESMPVNKEADLIQKEATPISGRHNMLYRGTIVTGGEGLAVVVATGRETEIGRIQKLVGGAQTPETPLQKDLRIIGNHGVALMVFICGSVFLVGILRGIKWLEMLKTAISLGVAAIPEGLPTVGTATLAVGVRRMQKHNLLIRNLGAVEALGAVDVVCLDKTGTLTLNNMTLAEAYVGGKRLRLKGSKVLDADNVPVTMPSELEKMLLLTSLCNEAKYDFEDGEMFVTGSGTETAFLRAAHEQGLDVKNFSTDYPKLKTEWRTEEKPYMKTIHKVPGESHSLLAVKGSPLEVLSRCAGELVGGEVIPLTSKRREEIASENEALSREGLRVLGVAYKEYRSGEDYKKDWTWLGQAGLFDPPREGMEGLIAELHNCGIHTCMMTGDQALTASAVGEKLKLNGGPPLDVLDASEFMAADDAELAERIEKTHVFSRVSPSEKQRIVAAFQKKGKVVAMTGDGINDGPALRAADIGIAMGKSGTEAARQAADVVLSDDRLETLIHAIRHGRSVRFNLKNSIRFILSTNISESLTMLGALTIGASNPFNARQLLWINLVTDIFPGLALALNQNVQEPDLRHKARHAMLPSEEKNIILQEALILTLGTLAAYKYAAGRYGEESAEARTVAGLTLVSGQMLHIWQTQQQRAGSPRQGTGKLLWAASAGGLLAQVGASFLPGVRDVLGNRPIRLRESMAVAAGSVLPFLINSLFVRSSNGFSSSNFAQEEGVNV